MSAPTSSRTAKGRGGSLRIAFAVWATALACGVLFHEWQKGQPPWSINTAVALSAIWLLLRPTSPARLAILFGLLAGELAFDLPDPYNHTLLLGVTGGAIFLWWLVAYARSRPVALDPAAFYERVTPFLRTVFVLSWFIIAFGKINEGFLDTSLTCAAWIVAQVPILEVPEGLNPLLIAATYVVEFAIPILLIIPRTRPIAVALGFGFHLAMAAGGHTAFSGFGWSFYLLFLPAGTLARAAAIARAPFSVETRRLVARAARSRWTWVALSAIWLLGLAILQILPEGEAVPRARRWGAALPYFAYAGVWAWILIGHRARLLFRYGTGAGIEFRFREPAFAAALVLLVANAASPYVGLKTRYSFTMYSNLQTEPGHWNHLIVPERVRVFGWQDDPVRLIDIDHESLVERVEAHGTNAANRVSFGDTDPASSSTDFVLLDVRLMASQHPDAAVIYALDGTVRSADPVASDPVIGDRPSAVERALGGFRPVTGVCQH